MNEFGLVGYDDFQEIGRGGYGVVYRARQIDFGREVAIKVITAPVDAQVVSRFDRERLALGSLSGHPNIVTVFTSGITPQGQPYIVMEYLAGGSLADRVQIHRFEWPDAVEVGQKIGYALDTAHDLGVLHRDVKPANILLSPWGEPKLADFGLARLDGVTATASGVITASIAHAAPEILEGAPPSVASDIYSLSSTVYSLMAGLPPFMRDSDVTILPIVNRILREAPPDLRPTGVPSGIVDVLEQAMAKDPAHRPASAAAFASLLGDAAAAAHAAAAPAGAADLVAGSAPEPSATPTRLSRETITWDPATNPLPAIPSPRDAVASGPDTPAFAAPGPAPGLDPTAPAWGSTAGFAAVPAGYGAAPTGVPPGPPMGAPPPFPPAGPPAGPPPGPPPQFGPPPGAPPAVALLPAGAPPPRRRATAPLVLAIAAVVVLLVGAFAAFFVLRGKPKETAATEVFLESASSQGMNPFTTYIPTKTAESVTTTTPKTPPSTAIAGATTISTTSGATPGLYGGTQNLATCDPNQMADFLDKNPDKAKAWVDALNTDPDLGWKNGKLTTSDIRAYVKTLTPVALVADTRVTNYGYDNGAATPRQSVLQAGTAVLIDALGVPRTKCACGNPLTKPVAASTPAYTNAPWMGFSPTNVNVVTRSPNPIVVFVLTNIAGPGQIERPIGTTGTDDTLDPDGGKTTTTAPVTTSTTAPPAPGKTERAQPPATAAVTTTTNAAGITPKVDLTGDFCRDLKTLADSSKGKQVNSTAELQQFYADLAHLTDEAPDEIKPDMQALTVAFNKFISDPNSGFDVFDTPDMKAHNDRVTAYAKTACGVTV